MKELAYKKQNRPNVEVADKLHVCVTKKVDKPKLTKLKCKNRILGSAGNKEADDNNTPCLFCNDFFSNSKVVRDV